MGDEKPYLSAWEFVPEDDWREQVIALRIVCPHGCGVPLIELQCPAWERPVDPTRWFWTAEAAERVTETTIGYAGTAEDHAHVARRLAEGRAALSGFADVPNLDDPHKRYAVSCPGETCRRLLRPYDLKVRGDQLGKIARHEFASWAEMVPQGHRLTLDLNRLDDLLRIADRL